MDMCQEVMGLLHQKLNRCWVMELVLGVVEQGADLEGDFVVVVQAGLVVVQAVGLEEVGLHHY